MVIRICEERYIDRLPQSDCFEGTSISWVDGRADIKLEGVSYAVEKVKNDYEEDDYCTIKRGGHFVEGFVCESLPTDIVKGDVDGNGTEDLIIEVDGKHFEYLTAEWWEPPCDSQAEQVEKMYQDMMNQNLPMWQRRDVALGLVHYEIEHEDMTNFFTELSKKPDFYPEDPLYAAEYFEKADMIEKAIEIYTSVAMDPELDDYHRKAAKESVCRLLDISME
jgi:hypothetical protein